MKNNEQHEEIPVAEFDLGEGILFNSSLNDAIEEDENGEKLRSVSNLVDTEDAQEEEIEENEEEVQENEEEVDDVIEEEPPLDLSLIHI